MPKHTNYSTSIISAGLEACLACSTGGVPTSKNKRVARPEHISETLSTATFYSMNPEPIAPAAPILVHSLEEDGDYPQQHEVDDRINIDICTTKHKSGTGTGLRLEKATGTSVKYSHRSEQNIGAGNDRINIGFRADIRPPCWQQNKSDELERGLGEATARPPAVLQESLHVQQDFQSAAGITLAELENDLRYQCVKAQLDPCESQDQCSVSCAKWYTNIIRLFSCHTFTRNLCRCRCGRFEDLVLNNKLQRAYVVGWAMLMSSVFPLAPNNTFHLFWALCQLVIFLLFGLLSVLLTKYVFGGLTAVNIAQFVLIAIAFLLACCDVVVTMFLRFSRPRNQQPPEAESLLHHNRQTRSCFKDWLYRYNDLLRLTVTEIVTYLILVSTIMCSSGCRLNIFVLVCSSATFLTLVYASQLVFFVRFTVALWKHLKPLPTTRHKAMWLLFRFLLHFVGYRILQTLFLVLVILLIPVPDNIFLPGLIPVNWAILLVGILTYLTPIVGVLTFLIMKHGWILDLCIVYCTDYLSYLNTIQRNPDTGQETKQSIRAALTKFEFETLMQESQEYRKGNRCAVNSVYLFNPLMLLLSLPIMICLGALCYSAVSLSVGFGVDAVYMYCMYLVMYVVPVFTFVNHIHLMLVYLAWPVLLLYFFIYAMVFCLWHVIARHTGTYSVVYHRTVATASSYSQL